MTPSRLENLRAVVFDLDGTLIDSYDAIADSVNHARGHFGLAPLAAQVVRGGVGRGLETLIAELVGPDHVEEGVSLFRERYARIYARRTRALPDAVSTVEALRRRGYALAVASNKPSRFSRPILERLGLAASFRCILGPDDAGTTKPDPAMIRQCLERLEAKPTEAVYVGDMPLDVESASRAGVPVVLVAGGSADRRELELTGQRTLSGIGELARLLST